MYTPPQSPDDDISPRKPTLSEGPRAIIVCSGIVVLLIWLLAPIFRSARIKSQSVSCSSNLKQLALATMMYTLDNGERMPPSGSWMDRLPPYIHATAAENRRICSCPALSESGTGYAFNKPMGSALLESIERPNTTLLIYDSVALTRNAADPAISLPPGGRHSGRNNIAFADGHVRTIVYGGPYILASPQPFKSLKINN